MVSTASTYLFEATEKRFFFKTVSILIPETWDANPEYKRPKHESYKHVSAKIFSSKKGNFLMLPSFSRFVSDSF